MESVESVKAFALSQFPSLTKVFDNTIKNLDLTDIIERKERFQRYLLSILPTNLPSKYNFAKVRGDGSCFFHTILRYFGYLTWMDLPNKDSDQFTPEEEMVYQLTLSNLRNMATEYIRNFIGDPTFVLDPSVPEYQLICKFISDTSNLRIVILEYDYYKSDSLNKVGLFEPESGIWTDSVILINYSHHFTLIFPSSTDPSIDTKTIRGIVADELIVKARSNGRLF